MRRFVRPLPLLLIAVFCAASPEYWPESWFLPPETASQRNITEFRESPLLSELVSEGKLPPVEERLPDDPIVIDCVERPGDYGGDLRIFDSDRNKICVPEMPITIGPEARRILPNILRKWQCSDDGRSMTLFIRKGLKWSDGHAFTVDAFEFHFKYEMNNPQLTPVKRREWVGSRFVRIDDYTFRYEFADPYPFFENRLAQAGNNYFSPGHFLRRYHPDFVGKASIESEADEKGYISWMAFYNAVKSNGLTDAIDVPTMESYVLVQKSPLSLKYRRNPYYFKIDSEGKQLPYVDTITDIRENNDKVIAAKTTTGQVDFSAYSLKVSDIPLYKLGEETNTVRVMIWKKLFGSDVCFQPNLNHKKPRMRSIMNDLRFRKALSLALDRDEMNNIIYFGKGTPRQVTVIPTSRYYEKSFAEAYTEYDPRRAEELLDEMGLKDIDGDGMREHREGDPLVIVLEWLDFEGPKLMTVELACEYWRKIGLRIKQKQVDRNLMASRAQGGMMDMTLWHSDRTTDILFPVQPFWWVPMHKGWEESHWNDWSQYYLTDGEQGVPPPGEIGSATENWKIMKSTTDPELQVEMGKKVLQSNAENLWTIGTVGLSPVPVVVKPGYRNVPEMGYWGWDNRFTMSYHPETWFLESK